MQQSLVILDLCLRETQSGKLHDYRDAVCKMFPFCTKAQSRPYQIPQVKNVVSRESRALSFVILRCSTRLVVEIEQAVA